MHTLYLYIIVLENEGIPVTSLSNKSMHPKRLKSSNNIVAYQIKIITCYLSKGEMPINIVVC